MYAGAQGATLMSSCDEPDCQASLNFRAEKRTITMVARAENDGLDCDL
jgi:hypothetical protein